MKIIILLLLIVVAFFTGISIGYGGEKKAMLFTGYVTHLKTITYDDKTGQLNCIQEEIFIENGRMTDQVRYLQSSIDIPQKENTK